MTEREMTSDIPIRVSYDDKVLDWGIASLPRVVLRFYRHLRCDDERLDDREMMPLLLLLGLWEDRDQPLRLSNLPSATPLRTLEERYLAKWRRMGLVFTQRVYYTQEEMAEVFGENTVPDTPRMKARLFDVCSLLYNCLRAAQAWEEDAYPKAHEAWEKERERCQASGETAPQPPHPHFPPGDFTVDVELPPNLAAEIASGEACPYQFVPDKWVERASEAVEDVPTQIEEVRDRTPTNRVGTGDRTPTNHVGTQPRTYTNRVGHLAYTSLREDTLSADAESGPPDGPAHPSQKPKPSPPAADQGPPRRLPAGESAEGPAGPTRVPSRGEKDTPARPARLRVEPLPERRRRVLDDLRHFHDDRRTQISIITQSIGQILGLGLDGSGGLRTEPEKDDYARVGALVKRYSPQAVWKTACRAAGQAIDGDPLDYLQACLRHRREDGSRGRRDDEVGGRDDYPGTPDEYGDGWEV